MTQFNRKPTASSAEESGQSLDGEIFLPDPEKRQCSFAKSIASKRRCTKKPFLGTPGGVSLKYLEATKKPAKSAVIALSSIRQQQPEGFR
jgi:hypothetical protein